MFRNFLTRRHKRYWSGRKIDWRQAYCDPSNPAETINHPHRNLIIGYLKKIRWNTLLEAGCASGGNLFRIQKEFPNAKLGGVDISEDAIATARQLLRSDTILEVNDVRNLFFNDASVDVVLLDMGLIYLDPFNIHKALKEIKRVLRKHLILVEFHSRNPFKRWALRLLSGYNAYHWPKLLSKYGFYDVEMYKLTEKDWPSGEPQKSFGYLITAKI